VETNQMNLAGIACFCLFVTTTSYGTGGDDYEHVAKLSDTLDMLPGKSLGEIFLETSKIPEAQGPLDLETPARDLANRLGKEPLPQLLKAADDLIAQSRLHYVADKSSCNFAHDLRDAIAVSTDNPEAARDYILWRAGHPQLSDTLSDLDKRAEAAKRLIKANWLYACGATRFTRGDRTECQEWFDHVVKEFPNHPRAEIAMFMSARCAFSASRSAPDEDEKAKATARKNAVAKFEALRKRYPRGRFDADALGWLGALAFDAGDYLKALDLYIAQAETPGHPETLRTAIYNCEKTLAHLAPKPASDAAFALIARHPRIAMAFTYLVISAPEADNYDGKWDNPADVRKWRRAILPRIAAAVAKQKDAYKSGDWQPRYLAMLVHAASSTGNHAQALQLSQIAPNQLARSDDLLFARAVALQRANKIPEAIETFQTLLHKFPKTPLLPGAKVRLALALQDNHQAGDAVATLCELLPKPTTGEAPVAGTKSKITKDDREEDTDSEARKVAADESQNHNLGMRFTHEGVYPTGEAEWKISDSAVYPNLSGADEEQLYQLIDTLLNFAPLPELAAALNNNSFDKNATSELRAILAERYLVTENFAEAKKFIVDPNRLQIVNRLEQLTNNDRGSAQEKAERMMQLGNAWAEARGQLLRAPLDTKLHLYERAFPMPGLTRRENGQTLHLRDVEDQLDDRDEMHHASRWWLRAARSVPGTPLAAKARLKALEALPQIARVSSYAEQRAREIKLDAVSREIYDKLLMESPSSPEARRFAAYWSVPPLLKADYDTGNFIPWEIGDLSGVVCEQDASALGYPFSDNNAFESLLRADNSDAGPNSYRTWEEISKRIAALRDRAAIDKPTELLREVKALDELARENITGVADVSTGNCLDDLLKFLAEPDVTREAQKTYVNIRVDLLHRTHWVESSSAAPPISVKDDDDAVEKEIRTAEQNPALKSFRDYLEFCRIGLIAGKQTTVKTDITTLKDGEDQPVTYSSRDYAAVEKMTRDFLNKYPHSHKREAALFVLARAVYSLSSPVIVCVGVPAPGTQPSDDVVDIVKKPYRQEKFKPERVMKALDDYDLDFPNGRYAAEVLNLRAATLWRMQQWDKALDLTLRQLARKTKRDLQGEAGIRLANIFAELANMEHRSVIVASIHARPAAIPYLQAYLAAATKDRGHPLRYLQRYVSDQLHIKIPAPDESVASN
jgi:TolA-binding protein